jgi:aminoglycoside phosphotransferase (APT) family kinase protein
VETDDEIRRILLRAFPDGRFLRCQPLGGGVSARAVVADIVLPHGETKRIVVRRPNYSTPEETRRVVGAEHALLERCVALGLPVPAPCFLDLDAGAVGLCHLEGAPEFAPPDLRAMLEQMARALARIHAVPPTGELGFLGHRNASFERTLRSVPERLDLELDEPRIRSVLRELWPWEQHNADVLLHGDYWPGNLLWQNGTLAAVIDWEEAERGDPLADLAVSRLDLSWAFGDAAMHEFTEKYVAEREIDLRRLPHWDLAVALRPMSNLPRWASSYRAPEINRPDVTESSMRDGHRRFVLQALAALGVT